MRLELEVAFRRLTLAASLVLFASAAAYGQTTQAPPPPPPASSTATPPETPATTAPKTSTEPVELPVDITRISKRLETKPAIKLGDPQVRFYVEVIAKQRTFKEYIGDRDLRYGPVPGAQMTHQEFLSMVTPKMMNSSAGITATETLQMALFSWAVQSAVKKGVAALRNARDEAEVKAIRAQIDRELVALRGGGGH